MKKHYITKVEQNGQEFFVLVADPRTIVKMIIHVAAGQEQDAQRPWNEGRVREIAKYVARKFKDDDNKKSIGLIPNAPILNIKDKLDIKQDDSGYFVELPETSQEVNNYLDALEVIDGQHRIRAFMDEYIHPDFPADKRYEMVFTLFNRMSEREKREIFMITNEKQVKVPGNLLRLFKRELDLLKGDELVYDLVETLNKEDFSPLKKRIMIGAQKITKGYQESQLSKILNVSDTYKVLEGRHLEKEQMAKVISNYISAWEKKYEVSYKDPGKETITKISGLRYIFFMFPACLDILGNRKKPATTDEFAKIIGMLPDATGIDDVFADESTVLSFRGETGTIQLARDHANRLKMYEQKSQSDYDITEGI